MNGVKALGVEASENSVRATLSSDRRERFVRVEPGVYYLKELVDNGIDSNEQTQPEVTPET